MRPHLWTTTSPMTRTSRFRSRKALDKSEPGAPVSIFHPTEQIDEKHARAFRLDGRIHHIMCSIALGLGIFGKLLAAKDARIPSGWPKRFFLKDIEITRFPEQIGFPSKFIDQALIGIVAGHGPEHLQRSAQPA